MPAGGGGILVGAGEPDFLKAVGTVAGAVERRGVDYLWSAFGGLVGVQRKEVGDLFSSIDNGRLNTELGQARSRLNVVWLLIEGRLPWDNQGRLTGTLGRYHSRWSRDGFWAFLSGIQAAGVWVAFTDDMAQTLQWLERTAAWSWKENHTSLLTRRNPRGEWGKATSEEWLVHLYASFEGVSVGKAKLLIDGGAKLSWNMTAEQMQGIKGIGPKLASRLTQALDWSTVPTLSPDEAGSQASPGSNREGSSDAP